MSKRWFGGVLIFLIVLFCVGFAVFSSRARRSKELRPESSSSSKSLIDKPLPPAQLVDANGAKVDEQLLRNGRVIIVFVTTDCDACLAEGRFLQSIPGKRNDVAFYGVNPFGRRPESAGVAEKVFPFKVFYDDGNSFVQSMGINRVPVKVFLEDGIIKKGWIGAALTDQSKKSFLDWFDSLP
jgi:hypothetical protein